MGQIVHNISTPNDGLGEKLRAAFEDQNTMNAELYASKVDAVSGYGLSKNDFTDVLKAKLDALDVNAEQNVQSDWNELDPTSDAFILGKPIFNSSQIDVSALWVSGLIFDVVANAFPVNGVTYAATSAQVTLDAADATLDRIDLIVAIKPVSPATIGTVGFIKGTPASPSVVVPPDYDPSEYYVIKQVTVKAAQTTPDGISTTQVYDEGVEWTVAPSENIVETTSDPSTGTKSLEATDNLITDNVLFTAPSQLSTEDIGAISFDLKLKEAAGAGSIFIEIYLAGVRIKLYTFSNGSNGFVQNNLAYQNILIDKSKLNLPVQNFDKIRIRPYWASDGYFIDNVVIHTGSGAETVPDTGIPEAPEDGTLYGRKNKAWEAVPAAAADMTKAVYDPTNVNADAFDMDNMAESATAKVMTADERTKLASLDAAIVLKGSWDATGGSFPSGAEAGWSYIVVDSGTVDGVEFNIDDRIIALVDGASTSVYDNNWHKADYTDLSFSSEVQASAAKTTLADADLFGILDSAASLITKKITWANIKTALNALYVVVGDFLEEKLQGTGTEDAALTGAESIDLALAADAYFTLTGNTTISVTNTPSADKSFVRTWTIKSTATETLTLPVAWVIIGEYVADGSENFLTIRFSNFTTAGAKVVCYITQDD